ncbi:MAG: hypothetical protein AB8B47_10495 [Roseobacter sp.]
MTLFIGIIAAIGGGVALHEWRKGRTLLAHDLGKPGAQTEADRTAIRAQSEIAGRMGVSEPPSH